MTQVRKNFVREVKVTYEDGTHETFHPTVGEQDGQPKPSGYYIERLNWSQGPKGNIDALLVCHEIYWVERHEGVTTVKQYMEMSEGPREGE